MLGFVDNSFPVQYGVPQWMIIALRTLGFALHAAFMGLWYAGIPLAVLMARSQNLSLRQISRRLMLQMPVIVALGVNLGIVPLLFLQAGFGPVVYSATILVGWFWLAIIALLIPAYYGVYLYGWDGIPVDKPIAPWRLAVGIIAGCLFVAIGFLFANGFSFTFRLERWETLWERAQVAGAATGLTVNIDDPVFWPRWLFIFSLALQTTACWMVLDASIFRPSATVEDRRLAARLASRIYLPGFVGALVFGLGYLYHLGQSSGAQISAVVGQLPGVVPGLVAVLIPIAIGSVLLNASGRQAPLSPKTVVMCVGLHIVYLVCVGFLRIWADLFTLQLSNRYEFWGRPVAFQWSPFLLFVVTLIMGIAVVSWMIVQVLRNLMTTTREAN
ncbi:MAG: hypothetical protein NZ899_03985 [Thermoguttaceae bacterium]|nr:hypothetical protein [Thermoguttaceae bacterium]MDW8077706.1 hypothetical protein [Thermoguttaceae bacterium]